MVENSSIDNFTEKDHHHVLIADGNKLNRRLMRGILEKTSAYDVVDTADGKEALELLDKLPLDLVIAGENLPTVHVLNLLTEVRQRYGLLPVIVTAEYGGSTGVEVFQHGADDCIYLPLHAEEFIFRIERALRYHNLINQKVTLQKANEELWDRAITDRLTGLYNRQYFEEIYQGEFERTRRYRSQLGCAIFDIDHFKKVNDDYGHLIGDVVLREIGMLVRDTLRRVDVAARYGGEEFVVLMPETTREGLKMVCERIRTTIENFKFCQSSNYLSKPMQQVTISLGAAHFPCENIDDALTMLKIADENLYRAKHNGRNRLEVAWE